MDFQAKLYNRDTGYIETPDDEIFHKSINDKSGRDFCNFCGEISEYMKHKCKYDGNRVIVIGKLIPRDQKVNENFSKIILRGYKKDCKVFNKVSINVGPRRD